MLADRHGRHNFRLFIAYNVEMGAVARGCAQSGTEITYDMKLRPYTVFQKAETFVISVR